MPGLLVKDSEAHDGDFASNISEIAVLVDSGKREGEIWFDQKQVGGVY